MGEEERTADASRGGQPQVAPELGDIRQPSPGIGGSAPVGGQGSPARSRTDPLSEPAASNAGGAESRDGAELGEGRGSAEISRGKRVRRSPRLSTCSPTRD